MSGTNSGSQVLVTNTLERLISSDPNRAQAFGARQLAETMRYLLDAQTEEDVTGGGYEVMGSGQEESMRATVLNGLRALPVNGSNQMNVTGGAILLIDNYGGISDDSLADLVVDPGINSGTLQLTPNLSGQIRIDVLCCARTVNVLETDNRDIFNPATGLFAPSTVTKVQASQLEYQIVVGTGGLGMPSIPTGWVPLMVSSAPSALPSGQTSWTWDACTLWDVRPLASDRTNGMFNTSRFLNWRKRNYARVLLSGSNQPKIQALIDLEYGGYRAGGLIQGAAGNYFDLGDSNNYESGFSFGTSNQLWHVYLVFPFGLPRWVQYMPATVSPRTPGRQRGIPVVSRVKCNFNGVPWSGVVATPAVFGLKDTAGTNAIMAFAGTDAGSGGGQALALQCVGQQWSFTVLQSDLPSNPFTSGPGLITPAPITGTISPNSTAFQISLSGGANVPGNARAVYATISGYFSYGLGGILPVGKEVVVSDGPTSFSPMYINVPSSGGVGLPVQSGAGFAQFVSMTVRIPLQPPLDIGGSVPRFYLNEPWESFVYSVEWLHGVTAGGEISMSNHTMTITGWELGA